MDKYLITHSLLSSWLYAMRDNPYADVTTERDPHEEFLRVLRREPTETTEAMQNGIDFEDLVTAIVEGHGDKNSPWYHAARVIADAVRGGQLQYKAVRSLHIGCFEVTLYGRLDALKAGTVYDIKFSKKYERGKFFGSTQHPTYLALVPEANEFVYLISNGYDVWTETYRRDETMDITNTISSFFEWLQSSGLMALFKEHWISK